MLIGLAAVAAIAIAEIVLSARWNLWYFTFGVPIFVRRVERPEGLEGVSLEDLQRGAATVAAAPFEFRRLASGAIAFREKGFGGTLHYFPLMRGLIRHDASEPSVAVIGLVNWTFLALVTLFVVLLGKGFRDIALYFALAYGVLYFIQAVRYLRVAKALRTQRE